MSFATEENITELARERWQTAHDPRLATVVDALVRHAHAFVREVEPTHAEWLAATEFLEQVGHISDTKRKEFILLSDVLGISMLVVMINGRKPAGATPDTVLGPFHIEDSPMVGAGGDLAQGVAGARLYVSGTVRNLRGAPIDGAALDVWQADEEGVYEAQLPESDARLRGILRTDAQGRFGFWTIAPKGYSIPMDGPVGTLVAKTDISHFRPAHIHFLLTAPGCRPVVTHLFQQGADYIGTDVVFGAKAELVVPFAIHPPGRAPDNTVLADPFMTVSYDFVLVEEEPSDAVAMIGERIAAG